MAGLVQLYNAALNKFGKGGLTSPSQINPDADACNAHYEQSRLKVLTAALKTPWSCALAVREFARLDIDPLLGYDYAYAIPESPRVLHIYKVIDPDDFNEIDGASWIKAGKTLYVAAAYTDVPVVRAVCVQDIEDVPDYDPHVYEAVVCRLAADIVLPLTKSVKLKEQLEMEYQTQLYQSLDVEGHIRESELAPSRWWTSDVDPSIQSWV